MVTFSEMAKALRECRYGDPPDADVEALARQLCRVGFSKHSAEIAIAQMRTRAECVAAVIDLLEDLMQGRLRIAPAGELLPAGNHSLVPATGRIDAA